MIKAVIFDMYETLITLHEAPLYFSSQMAEDMVVNLVDFLDIWKTTEEERTIGKISFEDIVLLIMRKNNCYSKATYEKVINKRKAAKQACFSHLHSEIVPMLKTLKGKNIKIGLISNCFSEEVEVIRESELFPFFDAPFMSYEKGIQKPNKEIYRRCIAELNVLPEECLYVGDGGSYELETAKEMNINPLQATWYLKENNPYQMKRNADFIQLNSPFELFKYI